MHCGSIGIIVRQPSSLNRKIALLDKNYGHIECITNTFYGSVGTVLSYSLHNKNNFFLRDVKREYVPLYLGACDVLFLHHIFEIIYYFAPLGSDVQGVFDLLVFLYTIEHMIEIRFKKFFLCKLLTKLGITAAINEVCLVYVSQLQTIAIDHFNEAMVDKEGEKKLDRWLWGCIWQHPYISEFKTVHFLEQNRVI